MFYLKSNYGTGRVLKYLPGSPVVPAGKKVGPFEDNLLNNKELQDAKNSGEITIFTAGDKKTVKKEVVEPKKEDKKEVIEDKTVVKTNETSEIPVSEEPETLDNELLAEDDQEENTDDPKEEGKSKKKRKRKSS